MQFYVVIFGTIESCGTVALQGTCSVGHCVHGMYGVIGGCVELDGDRHLE